MRIRTEVPSPPHLPSLLLLFSRSVMSDSLRLHGLKHTRLPCPSLFFLGLLKLMSIVMYRCESWTVKKAEHRRIDAFELRCWRRLWRVPLVLWPPDAKSQLIRKNPDAGKD